MGSRFNHQPAGHKFYVVFKGRKPGIYTSWIDCHSQVHKFKGTAYQSYPTYKVAEAAWLAVSMDGGNNNHEAHHHNIDAPAATRIGQYWYSLVEL